MTNTTKTTNETNRKAKTMDARWATIKRGDGKVTGYIELFYSKSIGKWVTVPGVSRFRSA